MNMFVGGAAMASATLAPEITLAKLEPTKIDRNAVRPELQHAFDRLEDAHEALKLAHSKFNVVWNEHKEWSKRNPQPTHRRAYKKWDRREERHMIEIGFDAACDAKRTATEEYHSAQLALGHMRALDFNELAFKAAASVAFEGGIMEKSQEHVRNENQIVAWSLGLDVILLSAAVGASSIEAA